ncbi:hypothetical protein G6M89_20385 [Natronolimnobius sp. AArcel1]|uniref:hypothetical protein n=1 Tax=Natronolimnobius sp. AArcel1 TaxID=1679093 RepID=UPI0013ECE2D2|nr:hypothetical protein [Natronolimnobius sp. AArcel1]NGM71328.1 hypothetical protein [Natronolimnobius sp. AArcel1]
MTQNFPTRRTVLSGIVAGAAVAVSGCSSSSDSGSDNGAGDFDGDDVFTDIFVEDTDLILEFTDESSIDQINVIDPSGELFDELLIPSGISRDTVAIGTDYDPGVYEIIALEDGDEKSSQSVTIEPDIRITDLRLGRNHPDEMFEGASDREIETEVILTLHNRGNGPDEIRRLVFDGDVPRPTSDEFDESGIYDTDSDIRSYADAVELSSDDEITIYSRQMPFHSADPDVSCSPDTTEGEFQVYLETIVQDPYPNDEFEVTYSGENLVDCDIHVEVTS